VLVDPVASLQLFEHARNKAHSTGFFRELPPFFLPESNQGLTPQAATMMHQEELRTGPETESCGYLPVSPVPWRYFSPLDVLWPAALPKRRSGRGTADHRGQP